MSTEAWLAVVLFSDSASWSPSLEGSSQVGRSVQSFEPDEAVVDFEYRATSRCVRTHRTFLLPEKRRGLGARSVLPTIWGAVLWHAAAVRIHLEDELLLCGRMLRKNVSATGGKGQESYPRGRSAGGAFCLACADVCVIYSAAVRRLPADMKLRRSTAPGRTCRRSAARGRPGSLEGEGHDGRCGLRFAASPTRLCSRDIRTPDAGRSKKALAFRLSRGTRTPSRQSGTQT